MSPSEHEHSKAQAVEGKVFVENFLPYVKWVTKNSRSRKVAAKFEEQGYPVSKGDVIRIYKFNGEDWAIKHRRDFKMENDLLIIIGI